MSEKQFWQRDVAETAQTLKSDAANGLSDDTAARRLSEVGPNRLEEKRGEGPLAMFLGQFRDVVIWVLIGAALISGVLKEWVDAAAIIGIVILNAVLGFIQEYRAEKALAALRRMASPSSRVIRSGRITVIPSSALVPGDLIEIEAGDHVPADSRLVSHTANFAVQEASLTGESAPVGKQTGPLGDPALPLGDRRNMVYMGTAVVSGKARALVTGTGMTTELGRIAGLIQSIDSEATPLQRKLDSFGALIVKICVILVAMVFLLQWGRTGWRMEGLNEVFLTAVSLAVAAIPEGLPAVVTIALALGVQRMVRRHALIRKLPSVETLGCATVICSDKTGTLTRNEMTVQALYAGGSTVEVSGVGYAPRGEFLRDGKPLAATDNAALRETLACGTLCNAAALREEEGQWRIVGDPTEGALLTVAAKAGLQRDALEAAHPLVEEIPFDSDRKMMSMIRRGPDGTLTAYVKGAPDVLLAHCTAIYDGATVRPLTPGDAAATAGANAAFADKALRVLAMASRTLEPDAPRSASHVEQQLTFLGLAAMIDPAREEAREAIRICKSAGIHVVMITGDHRNTAAAVARNLGMLAADDRTLTGEDLDRIDDDALAAQVEHVPVYARVAPEHKLRIVRAWRKRGHIVAMTGDGVNDAPAVKEADIGVAMGITGTDVTKEVSDMIVTDDNFASIVAAVEEGRGIYDNILKFVHYLLSCNAGEILVMFTASLLGMPAPLLPIHILWVNLVTDSFPALALGVDPVDRGIMGRPPRDPAEPVVSRQRGMFMLLQGAFIALCTLAAFAIQHNKGGPDALQRAQTAAFAVLSCSQLFHALNCRSSTKSIFQLGLFTNSKLLLAILVSMTLQVLVITLSSVGHVFKTLPLDVADWALVLSIASLPLWAMELVKWVLRRRSA